VGVEARIALVKAALGLDGTAVQDEKVTEEIMTPEFQDDQLDGETQALDESDVEEDVLDFAEASKSDSEVDYDLESEDPIDPNDKANPT
jgi:hypothetical protein